MERSDIRLIHEIQLPLQKRPICIRLIHLFSDGLFQPFTHFLRCCIGKCRDEKPIHIYFIL